MPRLPPSPQPALCLLLLASAGLAVASSLPEGCRTPGFFEGVASGDPLPDAVVLWTRFSPAGGENSTEAVPVAWRVAPDANLTQVAASGNVTTDASRDFTVKVDVRGLQPDQRYWFWFESGNYSSPLGVTRTAPSPGAPRPSLRLAISSCASWGFGYFHVMNATARVRDIDFLLFLGDWMSDPESQEMSRRVPIVVTWDDHDLADNSYAEGSLDQGRADAAGVSYAQRKANAVQAFYEYLPIRDPPAAAGRPWPPPTADLLAGMYRALTWGRLATLVTTDQRFSQRTEPIDALTTPYGQALQEHDPAALEREVPDLAQLRAGYYANLSSPANVMIGDEQLAGLARDLNASVQAGVTWQLYADQVIMGERRTPDVQEAIRQLYSGLAESALTRLLGLATDQLADAAGVFTNARVLVSAGARHDTLLTDGWDGYLFERNQILDLFQALGAAGGNPVSLAGDSHNAWAFELPASDGSRPVAVEFCTASVTPPGLERGLGFVPGIDLKAVMMRGMFISNPSQKYAQIHNRGLVVATLTRDRLHAEFVFVDRIDEQEYSTFCDAAFEVQAGQPGRLVNATCTPQDQLLFNLYSQDDPLAGYGLFQPARNQTQLAEGCPEDVTHAGAGESEEGILQRVGGAISGLFG